MAGHRGRWVEPLSIDYRGYTIYELPPPSQGVAALQALEAEGLRFAGRPTTRRMCTCMVESKKLAFADRDRYLGDPRT